VIPFLRIGSLPIPTFGLMVAVAMLTAFFVLRADFRRRGIASDAELFIAVPCLAGIIGAKLYHVLESPAEFFAHPLNELFSQFGFAWFGGLLAGFAAFVWLARREELPLWVLMDAGSPAAALGYGVGRIGCFLSGDGDYGIPTSLPWGMTFPNGLVPTTERVHPTPIYELIVACVIAWTLWRMGARQIVTSASKLSSSAKGREKKNRVLPAISAPPTGSVFAAYLVLTGIARFLVEFIRINPRSFFGLTNAQAASVGSVIAGVLIWWQVWRR